jgi:hypothetical protein
MELVGVRVELPSNSPILLLREVGGEGRMLPIFIGGPEATAIAFALDGIEPPRPMTHDLFATVLGELGARLDRITVTELRDNTFFAELHLIGDGHDRTVSARPSDAVALAVRAGSDIFADEQVLAEAGYLPDDEGDDDEPDAEEMVEEFREFINRVNPEDFAS